MACCILIHIGGFGAEYFKDERAITKKYNKCLVCFIIYPIQNPLLCTMQLQAIDVNYIENIDYVEAVRTKRY